MIRADIQIVGRESKGKQIQEPIFPVFSLKRQNYCIVQNIREKVRLILYFFRTLKSDCILDTLLLKKKIKISSSYCQWKRCESIRNKGKTGER